MPILINQNFPRRKFFLLLKVAFAVLLLYNIYHHLFVSQRFDDTWKQIQSRLGNLSFTFVGMTIALMFLNWGIEALKWYLLIRKAEPLNLLTSLKAVFCGVAVSMLTPNRVGEYAGRLLVIRKENFLRIINLTLIGSFAQMVALIFFGMIGLEYFVIRFSGMESHWIYLISIASGSLLVFAIFFYFNLKLFYILISRIKILGKWRKYFRIWNYYSYKDLLQVLGLSIFRYLVYTLQFLLLLEAFVPKVPDLSAMAMIMVIYFLQFIIPSIALADLGIRENLAITFFGYLNMAAAGVVSATLCLWIVNLILPALIGTFFIFKINISKTKTYGSS